jgi:hypothetical protein
MNSTTITQTAPTTFKDLKKGSLWRSTLHLLKKTGKTVMVAEGEACMGRYSAVVLTGKGFQLEQGKSGLAAAYSRSTPTHTPIKTVKKVLENAIELSGPMSDDPPGTPRPSESEIVTKVLKKIDKIRGAK